MITWEDDLMHPERFLNARMEEVLIRKALMGCLDSFNQLVLHYQGLAYHHAYALLSNTASAEDVTQESFIKAFKSIGGFRGGSFRAWLLTIVTHTAYDLLRKHKRQPVQCLIPEDDDGEEIETPAWLADPSPSVEATVEQYEDARRLYQLLDELPAIYRSVITLADLYELDYEEVAEVLQVPVGTVKSRLSRARWQMKRKLQNDFEYFPHFNQTLLVAPA